MMIKKEDEEEETYNNYLTMTRKYNGINFIRNRQWRKHAFRPWSPLPLWWRD